MTRSLSSPKSVVRSHSAPSCSYVLPAATSRSPSLRRGRRNRASSRGNSGRSARRTRRGRVLLAAQRRHGEAPDRFEIVAAASPNARRRMRARSRGCIRRDSRLPETARSHRGFAHARLHREREILDLRAGVVVIELAVHASPCDSSSARSRRRARRRVRDRRAAGRSDWPKRIRP